MQSKRNRVAILGTGGTIAGTASHGADNVGYTAGQLGVAQLLAAVPSLGGEAIDAEQVAKLDSKDMDYATWRLLATRVAHHLARPEIAGIVITHGTDTLEETAYFLQRVLAPSRPVVLTAAMRPATSLHSDGPQNLLDAVRIARLEAARGVVVAFGGEVHDARDVRKRHTYRIDAFGSGDAGVIGQIEEGALRQHRSWPEGAAFGVDALPLDVLTWPRVEIVHSHANADGRVVRALCADGVQGLVVAATGNGTLHRALEAALREARERGVAVLRSSRCLDGAVLEAHDADALPGAGALTPVKARIELLLQLMRAV
jgi:L-asparaginase